MELRLPEPGEWWEHIAGPSFAWTSLNPKYPKFIIDDVVYKNDLTESWVIYSNNDGLDYFVVQMWEFIQGNWRIADGTE